MDITLVSKIKTYDEINEAKCGLFSYICSKAYTDVKVLKYFELYDNEMCQTFRLNQIRYCKTNKANLLVIRGGIIHGNNYKDTYYLGILNGLCRNYNIYCLEKVDSPICSLNDSEAIGEAIKRIRDKSKKPIICIGFSMGGILLWDHLNNSEPCEHADFYIPTSCPLNMDDFECIIKQNAIFRTYAEQSLKHFKCKSTKELIEKYSSSTYEEYLDSLDQFKHNIEDSMYKWKNKCVTIIGERDSLLYNYKCVYRGMKNKPKVIIVKGGAHCCINCVYEIKLQCDKYLKC